MGHYFVIKRWSSDATIHLSVPRTQWSHPYVPAVAQVTGEIPAEMPIKIVRLAAIAPFILFCSISILLGFFLSFRLFSLPHFAVSIPLIFWGVPSPLDLNTFIHARDAKESGRFSAEYADVGLLNYVLIFLIGIPFGILVFLVLL
jgi:hypothetical protein